MLKKEYLIYKLSEAAREACKHNIGHFPYWKFSFSNLENTDFLI